MKKTISVFGLIILLIPLLQAQTNDELSIEGGGGYDFQSFKDQIEQYNTHLVKGNGVAFGFTVGAYVEITKEGLGLRGFTAAEITRDVFGGNSSLLGSIRTEMEFYKGGLGNSTLKGQRNKFNIEWRTSFMASYGYSDQSLNQVWGRPLFPSIGQAQALLFNPTDYGLSLGTCLIMGLSHDRHQQLGFFDFWGGPLSLNYFNDGPPFSTALVDSYDRFWSGNGSLSLHLVNETGFNSFEIRYSRYTGDDPFLYEVSSKLGLNYLAYKDETKQFLNKSRYQYRVGYGGHSTFGLSVYQPKQTDVQDWIHTGWIPLHSNPTKRYFGAYLDYAPRYFILF